MPKVPLPNGMATAKPLLRKILAEVMALVEGPGHGLAPARQTGRVQAHAPQIGQRDARIAHAREARTHWLTFATGTGQLHDAEAERGDR